jgi:hypothetical protein
MDRLLTVASEVVGLVTGGRGDEASILPMIQTLPDGQNGHGLAVKLVRRGPQPAGLLWDESCAPPSDAELAYLMDKGRGREGDCSPPPAQIRTCGTTAYGSCLES